MFTVEIHTRLTCQLIWMNSQLAMSHTYILVMRCSSPSMFKLFPRLFLQIEDIISVYMATSIVTYIYTRYNAFMKEKDILTNCVTPHNHCTSLCQLLFCYIYPYMFKYFLFRWCCLCWRMVIPSGRSAVVGILFTTKKSSLKFSMQQVY